ncbi:MAG: hypothetical protein M3505_01425, partial [Verrucomicrobiota bacterium]|nr:hypothetical protein [Verrucomicrobiota bacterium]
MNALMIADEIRELQHASPFEPYTIHTSDGKALYVHHPDYLFITPGNHTVYVFADETAREIVATRNITRVAPGAKKTRGK